MFRSLSIYLALCCSLDPVFSQPHGDTLSSLSQPPDDSSLVRISRLNINTAQADFSPFVSGKKLYFVSGRNNKVGVQYADAQNKTEITDLYSATFSSPVRAGSVRPLDGVNSKYYEGPFTLNRAGDTLYYTGNDRRSHKLKIFISTLRDGKWTEGRMLPFCEDTFSYCHPSLSASGRELYFSSDRTQGNMDIYYCRPGGGSWSDPVNAGAEINSDASEVFPFAGAEGMLFYSSNRAGGQGGLDLYVSKRSDSAFLTTPLPPPLNSAADDFGIWTDSSGVEGYFSTNRFLRHNDDIFRFERSIPDFSAAEAPPVRKKFCYTFYEETSMNTLDTANMAFEWRFGDGGSARGITARHCYAATGLYNVELVVVEKVSGEINSSVLNYDLEIPAQEQLVIDSRDTVPAGEAVLFNSSASSVKGFVLEKTWWNFGDGFFSSGPVVRHRYRREGKYVVQLWILATDKETGSQKKFKMTKNIVVGNLN